LKSSLDLYYQLPVEQEGKNGNRDGQQGTA
jgi:hypothetical protein